MTNPEPVRILIIDDNPADVMLAEECIKDTGINVVITSIDDGEKAIEFFNGLGEHLEERPDLVLIDLNLPKRNGHEILESIRLHDGQTKVIVYSGSKSPEDLKKAKSEGVEGYLVKPMTLEEIEATVVQLRQILTSCRIG
jgi:CheY-like chemotaxis protein